MIEEGRARPARIPPGPSRRGHRLSVHASVLLVCALAMAHVPAAAQVRPSGGEDELPFPVDPEAIPRPHGRSVEATTPIVVDGFLDEPAWEQAEPLTGFIQAIPDAGDPESERTEVLLLHDDRHLYVGARLYDSEPDRLVIQTLERDHPGVSAHDIDIFAVFIDTFLDRRNGFIFIVNPGGALRDGQTFDDSRNLDFAWDAVVDARTRIHDWGWTVEMAIPWTSLRFDPGRERQVWGMNFHRSVQRRNERSHWAPLDRRDQIHRASKAGTVAGPERIPRSRNLQLKPFALAQRASLPPIAEATSLHTSMEANGGIDLKYSVTPRLTLDLSWRTDFSHVEVDQEQVNLTRFPLFFPERRDFFVENSGIFQFGDQTEREYRTGSSLRDFTLFHSRTVGLAEGRPVPLVGGARLTGHVSGFEIGTLHARTEPGAFLPAEDFSVFRIRRGMAGNADLGLLVTNRRHGSGEGSGYHNRAFGVDGSFRPHRNMIVNTYLAGSSATDGDGDRRAGRVWVGWRDPRVNASAFVKQVGDGFDPGMGFVRRTAVRHGYATLGFHRRPALPHVLEVNPYGELHYVTNLGGLLETRTGTLGLGVDFLDGAGLSLDWNDRFERIATPFRIEGGAWVEAGDYDFREASVRYQSSRHRPLSVNVRAGGGGYFGGTRSSVSGGLQWQPNHHFGMDLSAQRNEIRMEAPFTADLYSVLLKYAYSTRLYSTAFLQYNKATGQVVSNFRLTFRHAPLSEFYLVFTERRDGKGDGIFERHVTVKVTRMLSF